MMTGTILRIERFAIHDGPGIRTTVFLKGCPLRCAWCHSPESQSPAPEPMPLPDRCIRCGRCVAACPEYAIIAPGGEHDHETGEGAGPWRTWRTEEGRCRVCGACVEACPTGARTIAGEQMSVAAVMKAIERDRIFYDESGGGVTFSGGEPLMQPAFLEALVEQCRARRIHVAVDTSGFGDPAALERIWPDLFLFDVKAIDEERHRAITGVSNRVILDNLARVAARTRAGRASLIVRFPLVPGVTDDDAEVREVGRTLSSLGISRIDVLPYHRAGLAKYERLGRRCGLPLTQPPAPERVRRVVEILSEHHLTVRVGGA
jgi:pyruvate formate lyase activating enzyme